MKTENCKVKWDLNTLFIDKVFFVRKRKWVAGEGKIIFDVIWLTHLLTLIIDLNGQENMSDM